jgi:hypothetical protein
MTTIKVSTQTRDRLKAQTAQARVPLGEHLRRLADAADRQRRFAALREAVGQTPPDLAESHAAETEEWETIELSDADGR